MAEQIGIRTILPTDAWPIGAAFTFRVLFTDDGTSTGTATDLTGRTYAFKLRPVGDNTGTAIVTKVTPTEITLTRVNGAVGELDAAYVSILSTDAAVPEGTYAWALWRTDDPNDRPEAHGTVGLVKVAAQ